MRLLGDMEFKKQPQNWYLYGLLFVTYLLYRLYFWGDIGQNYHHSIINAAGDAVVSISTGLYIFKLKELKKTSKKRFHAVSTLIVFSAIAILYVYHFGVYKIFGRLNAGFDSMFKAVCFQLLDSVAIVIIGSFSVIMDLMKTEKQEIRLALHQLERENLSVELKYLKAQLDPHFIFNSLNTIFYQLNETESEVKSSVSEFSEILRYHMKSNRESKIYIEEEVKYIKAYVQFNCKRQKEFLHVNMAFDIEDASFEIEPLLLLPIVENAFKFCSDESDSQASIDITLTCSTNHFTFEVVNTFNQNDYTLYEGEGIGLDNIKKRLALAYPGKHNLGAVKNETAGIFTTTLEIWN